MTIFYENYLKLCTANGLSKTKAAVDAGLSKGAQTNWRKRDKEPSPDSLLKISKYFGVTIEWLLTKHNDDEHIPLIKSGSNEVPDHDELEKMQSRIQQLEEKIKPGIITDTELCESERKLIELFRKVPTSKQPMVIQIIQTAVENL